MQDAKHLAQEKSIAITLNKQTKHHGTAQKFNKNGKRKKQRNMENDFYGPQKEIWRLIRS